MSKPPVYYSDYLELDTLLDLQHPKSASHGKAAHDETLFIIVHQAYELWFKQILHELDSVIALFSQKSVDETNVGTAVARLQRITEIQKVIIEQLRILETMTPLDFLDFRDYLIPASGFQSVQFRLIENKLGLRPQQRILYEKHAYHTRVSKEHQDIIRRSEQEPSLCDLMEKWLERTPFLEFGDFSFWKSYRESVDRMLAADRAIIENNPSLSDTEKAAQLKYLSLTEENFAALLDVRKHEALIQEGKRRLSHRATQAALLICLYRDQPILHQPYRLITVLTEIDELWTIWRYRHALMVQRMIGTKIGTGGSSGHEYLKTTAENHKVFNDLFNLSTFFIPRSTLPPLPPDVERTLGFYHSST